jgi:hypothetical protein
MHNQNQPTTNGPRTGTGEAGAAEGRRAREATVDKAEQAAEQATEKVAAAAGTVSKSLSDAAGRVNQPRVSDALRSTAQAAGRAEAQLRVKGARGMALGVAQWARAHPERYLLIALASGLLLRAMLRGEDESRHLTAGAVMVMEVKEIR